MADHPESPPGREETPVPPPLDLPEKREGYWRRLGGGSLTISIMLHAVILLAAVLWILETTRPVPETISFLPGGGGGGGGGSQQQISRKRQRAVAQNAPRTRIASAVSNAEAVTLPEVTASLSQMTSISSMSMGGAGLGSGEGPGRGSGQGSGVGSGIGSGWGPGGGAGFISLPKLYAGRCSPAERAAKMAANGGTPACEEAVRKGLDWLARNQNPDGSWGTAHKGGMTGLALLAYLGHCETPESLKYGETVLKAITYLVDLGRNQKEAMFAGVFSTKPHRIDSTYEHGIATYALGEMYSFAKLGSRELPGLREAFENGVAIIIRNQNEKGAWSYKEGVGYVVDARNDLSLTGWQFQALKAAKHTNLKITGLSKAINQVEDYLKSTQTRDGGFGNPNRRRPDGDAEHYTQWNLTGAALLGLQTLGSGNAGAVNKGIRWLMDETRKEPLSWTREAYLYTWYYNTQAMFQKGGDAWQLWNSQFQKELLANQLPEGNYRPESGGEVGAANAGAAGPDADIYRTALCTLMLEVYYRYLKVGDRGDDGPGGLQPIRTR